ncbi:MAG TPA: hypothetical protein VFA18_14475 [Gemmataceae bacterium]|nr:hypothetical protein [Gemmataceae bacterium]
MGFYLAVACFWLGLALFFLLGGAWSPQVHRLTLLFRFNPGWAALVLAVYSLVRWASLRALRASRQRDATERRSLERHKAEPPQEPDPAFDFHEKPSDVPNPKRHTSV